MSTWSRVAWYGLAGVLVVLGVVVAAVVTSTAGQVLALVLVGLGLVLVMSLIFLEVGLSEDRDRAREQKASPRGRFTGPPLRQPLSRQGPGKLDRLRGHRRRLR